MINTLENNTEISPVVSSPISTTESKDGEPPISVELTPQEQELLKIVHAIRITKDHAERKKLNDMLFPHNASGIVVRNLICATISVRKKLNSTLHPDDARTITALQQRIEKESEMLQHMDS